MTEPHTHDPDDADDTEDRDLDAALESDGPTTPALKSAKGESVAAAVGSFMAGIEQQVFQRQPPAVELVREHTPIRGTSADGLEVTIEVPPLPPER